MDSRAFRAVPRVALAAIAFAFVVGACGGPVETTAPTTVPTSPPVQTDAPTDLPGTSVRADLLGPWFQTPRDPTLVTSEAAAVDAPCRSALAAAGGDAALTANAPRVIADFRGLGQAFLVFADASHAAACRGVISADFSVVVSGVEALGPLGPAPADDKMEYVRYGPYDDVPSGRTVVIGRMGALARQVIVGFPDESETLASLGGGWFLVWWPGTVVPTGIGMTDARRLVIMGLPPAEGTIP